MATGVKEHWRVPLGYFLTARPLSADQQSSLLKEVIVRLHEVKVQVRCVVFDGTNANKATVEIFGAVLPESPSFQHPCIPSAVIYCILDNSHMIKLARNTLGVIDFKNREGDIISWSYIKKLHQIQNIEGLRFANQLSAAHVEYW